MRKVTEEGRITNRRRQTKRKRIMIESTISKIPIITVLYETMIHSSAQILSIQEILSTI